MNNPQVIKAKTQVEFQSAISKANPGARLEYNGIKAYAFRTGKSRPTIFRWEQVPDAPLCPSASKS